MCFRKSLLSVFACVSLWLSALPSTAAEPVFWKFPSKAPYKNPLEDILNHSSSRFQDPDLVTVAHETTHQVNSDARNSRTVLALSNESNALYVLQDRLFVVPEPKIVKLSMVARASSRGPLHQLYLVQGQQWWNDQPLYILDEMVAYTNRAIVGEYYRDYSRARESAEHARELSFYGQVLVEQLKKHEPGYDSEIIRKFIIWNSFRIPVIHSKPSDQDL